MAAVSEHKTGSRPPCSTDEHIRIVISRIDSLLELDDVFLQHGLGLLLIAKSDQDSVFRMLLASIKSPEEDMKQRARRALFRWARLNRFEAYVRLVMKAKGVSSVWKGEAIVDHFKSIPAVESEGDGEGDGERDGEEDSGSGGREYDIFGSRMAALQTVRWVSGSLQELVETRIAGMEGAEEVPAASPAAAVAAVPLPEQEGRECSQGEVEIENNGCSDEAKMNDNDEQESKDRSDGSGMPPVSPPSTSILAEAPLLTRASSRNLVGEVSAPCPPAHVAPRRNTPVRSRNCWAEALGSSGTNAKPIEQRKMSASEVAGSKERGGMPHERGCGESGAGTSSLKQAPASGMGQETQNEGAQAPRRSDEICCRLQKMGSKLSKLSVHQAASERRLTASMNRLEGVMKQEILHSLQRIEETINRQHVEQLQRMEAGLRQQTAGPASGIVTARGGPADTLPVAEVVGVACGTHDRFQSRARRTTANRRAGRTEVMEAVEVIQDQRGVRIPNGERSSSSSIQQRFFALYGGR